MTHALLELAAMGLTVQWLTKKEAAAVARVTTRTIERWIHDGILRAGGSPGHVLIDPDELQRTLERDRNHNG